MIKKGLVQIRLFAENYLLIRDVFNVVQWILAVYVVQMAASWVFGDVSAPAMGMSYLSRVFIGISAFSIYMVGAWMIMRIFFTDLAAYFVDKTSFRGKLLSQFDRDLRKVQGRMELGTETVEQCYKRLSFHLGFYLALLLAILLAATTL